MISHCVRIALQSLRYFSRLAAFGVCCDKLGIGEGAAANAARSRTNAAGNLCFSFYLIQQSALLIALL